MEDCLFCKMASGSVPAEKLHEDDLVFALRDINPRAPVHMLVIPREHIRDASSVQAQHAPVLSRMFDVASKLAAEHEIARRGYRIAFNVGEDAGMTIPHLHMHVIGGRHLGAEG